MNQSSSSSLAQKQTKTPAQKQATTLSRKHATRRAAMKAVGRSLFLNVVCSYLLYRIFSPRFPSGSLYPLALSGLPPLMGLVYGIIRQRAIDFIGFFAAEDIAVSMVSLVLAHSEISALVGRSLQNAVLGVIFLVSLLVDKPLVLSIARQFLTGNDPQARLRFDSVVTQPGARRVYRTLTSGWSVALFAKSTVSVMLAMTLRTQNYLIVSRIWDCVSDALLVWWSVNYGYRRLRHYLGEAESLPEDGVTPARNGTV
jgi:hypothetical protein